jgi:FlaA1/EpsC-like NDP-sugar epimerase
MAVVAVTALLLSIARPTLFLGLVSVFSFYLSFGGYRILLRKDGSGNWLDWLIALSTLAACAFFIVVSLANSALPISVWIPGVVFGLLGCLAAGRSIMSMLHPNAENPKMLWW